MTEPNRQSGENEERIIEIDIERLRPFKEHPFQVKDDKEMFLLQESIEKYGILNPLIVRPVPDGYYEIISGHRRKHAAEKLGYRKVPVIIRVLSEDDSILSMVDYENLVKETIDYESLEVTHYDDMRQVDEIVNLIVETVMCKNDKILIASNWYPASLVKKKFLMLTYSHIEYVLHCMSGNTTKVKNIKKYLLAALFNAPSTMNGYYQAEVNHDMPGLVR